MKSTWKSKSPVKSNFFVHSGLVYNQIWLSQSYYWTTKSIYMDIGSWDIDPAKHIEAEEKWHHLAYNILKAITLNEYCCILIEISPKFVPMGPIGNKSTLIQIVVGILQQWWPRWLRQICVTLSQWVKTIYECPALQSIRLTSLNKWYCNIQCHAWFPLVTHAYEISTFLTIPLMNHSLYKLTWIWVLLHIVGKLQKNDKWHWYTQSLTYS